MKKQIFIIGTAMLFTVGSVMLSSCGNSGEHNGDNHEHHDGDHHHNGDEHHHGDDHHNGEHHDDHHHDGEHMNDSTDVDKKGEAGTTVYICPMDCEKGKVYHEPGKCPVCEMDLEEKKEESPEE